MNILHNFRLCVTFANLSWCRAREDCAYINRQQLSQSPATCEVNSRVGDDCPRMRGEGKRSSGTYLTSENSIHSEPCGGREPRARHERQGTSEVSARAAVAAAYHWGRCYSLKTVRLISLATPTHHHHYTLLQSEAAPVAAAAHDAC